MAKRIQRRRHNRHGFTLMEVLLVMAILVIMAGLVTYSYLTIQQNAQADHANNQINVFESAIERYQLDLGAPPNTLEELRVAPQGLSNPKKWRGPYLGSDVPVDPWGQAYQYEPTGVDSLGNPKPTISSAGADRAPGTEDDISNIQTATTG